MQLISAAYSSLWNLWYLRLLFRNMSLVGALLLLLAESRVEGKHFYYIVEENRSKMYLQFAGRVMLVFVFVSLLRFEISAMQVTFLGPPVAL